MCYCIAYFSPQTFTQTHFGVLFSCSFRTIINRPPFLLFLHQIVSSLSASSYMPFSIYLKDLPAAPKTENTVLPCACAEWSGSSYTSGRTRTCRASPGGRIPLGMESGTRCPTRSGQTRWSLSCCCLLTPGLPDEASPVHARTGGKRRWGRAKRYNEDGKTGQTSRQRGERRERKDLS